MKDCLLKSYKEKVGLIMSYNALIVEDDIDIAHILSLTLTKMTVHTTINYSGQEALQTLKDNQFDLVILDLMLPELSGEEILPFIKENTYSKVIVISAKTDVEEKVKLLNLGADDYMTKPFDAKEVTARVSVQLRNLDSKPQMKQLKWKDLTLDISKYQMFYKNIEINLTNSEFEIMKLLMHYPEKAFSKQKIYESIQGIYLGDDNTINVHISNIRKKIALQTTETYIQTVWGIGFMLI